jgi:hypothetical protein
MFAPSRGRMVQRGPSFALAAGIVIFGHIQSLAPATAQSLEENPRLRDLGSGTAVADLRAEPPKLSEPVASDRATRGNPLWSVPLSSLLVTRERPIFSPSRRPPPPPVVAAPYVPPVKPPPPKPPEPDHPLLTLLGTVAGDNEGVGIFINQIDKVPVHLKIGEDHEGWVLRSVRGREAMFEKNNRMATLTLPSAEQPPMMDGDGRVQKPSSPVVVPQAYRTPPARGFAAPVRGRGPMTVQ